MLPLPVSGTAAAGPGAELRRGRRARHPAGLIGVLQATEAVKLILGTGKPLIGRLLLYDALDMTFREIKVRKNPQCPICGPSRPSRELIDYQQFCGVRGGEPTPARRGAAGEEITPSELNSPLDRGQRPMILDVRNPAEFAICRIAGSTVIPLPELPDRLGELDPAASSSSTARAASEVPRQSPCSRPPASPGSRISREVSWAGSRRSIPVSPPIDPHRRGDAASHRRAQRWFARRGSGVLHDLADQIHTCESTLPG